VEELTTLKYLLEKQCAELLRKQDKESGLLLTAEQEATSLRFKEFQNNTSTSVVLKCGDKVVCKQLQRLSERKER